MTYKGCEINEPTREMIQEYITHKGYKLDADKIFRIYNANDWTKKNGKPVQVLERVVDSMNSVENGKHKYQPEKHREIRRLKRERRLRLKQQKQQKTKRSFRRDRERIPYKEQLRDKRWLEFRAKVLKKHHNKCSVCGAEHNLQVHHLRYKKWHYAWEYRYKDVTVLCVNCHEKTHGIDLDRAMDLAIMND